MMRKALAAAVMAGLASCLITMQSQPRLTTLAGIFLLYGAGYALGFTVGEDKHGQ